MVFLTFSILRAQAFFDLFRPPRRRDGNFHDAASAERTGNTVETTC